MYESSVPCTGNPLVFLLPCDRCLTGKNPKMYIIPWFKDFTKDSTSLGLNSNKGDCTMTYQNDEPLLPLWMQQPVCNARSILGPPPHLFSTMSTLGRVARRNKSSCGCSSKPDLLWCLHNWCVDRKPDLLVLSWSDHSSWSQFTKLHTHHHWDLPFVSMAV